MGYMRPTSKPYQGSSRLAARLKHACAKHAEVDAQGVAPEHADRRVPHTRDGERLEDDDNGVSRDVDQLQHAVCLEDEADAAVAHGDCACEGKLHRSSTAG